MPTKLDDPRPQQKASPQPGSAGMCPCCAGPLILLSGAVRCARCHFTFCIGCDSGVADLPSGENY
jgi:hypothetical protein